MVAPKLVVRDYLDHTNNPAGGEYESIGLSIRWQKGPLKYDGETEMVPPNGAFLETVITAAIKRLEFFQSLKNFKCEENEQALEHLYASLDVLNKRQQRRREQGTEGTHKPDQQGKTNGSTN